MEIYPPKAYMWIGELSYFFLSINLLTSFAADFGQKDINAFRFITVHVTKIIGTKRKRNFQMINKVNFSN